MKAKILSAGLVLILALGAIVGNTAFVSTAFAADNVPSVNISTAAPVNEQTVTTSQSEQPASATAKESVITIRNLGNDSYTAERILPTDISADEAAKIALKATEDKYGISLDGWSASVIFTKMQDQKGNYYFVSFVDPAKALTDLEMLKNKENFIKGQNPAYQNPDIYIVFVNASTKEVVSVEKNPSSDGINSDGTRG